MVTKRAASKSQKQAKAEVTKEKSGNVFIGQEEASVVVHWMENPNRPVNDPVEQLIWLEARFQAGDMEAGRQTADLINQMVYKWKLGLAPVASFDTLDGRVIVQRATTDMKKVSPDQSLAFMKAVELMQAGLLTRIRRCKREGCGKWFFAKFEHSLYHTEECRLQSMSSSPQFRERRKKYMRERRKHPIGGK